MQEFMTNGDDLFYNTVAAVFALWEMALEVGPDDPRYDGLLVAAASFKALTESYWAQQKALLN